jgi:predicted transcriptional regulator
LASYLGVSRQTVYNWQRGEVIADHNQAVLEQFAIAADVLKARGLRSSNRLLKRSISDGKSLVQLVREGASGESTASALLSMLERETAQRDRLAKQLSSRQKRPVNLEEIGLSDLDGRTQRS